jgi:hypothetical protein
VLVSKNKSENLLVDRARVGVVRVWFVEQGAQQDGDRQFAAAVDARVHDVLGIEFEIQPGAAIGDDARREQQLAGGVGLAFVVIEEYTPGERCNWETMTRSVPLMTKVPLSVISGSSPM